MATAGTIIEESVGSLKLLIIPFTAVSNTNTYASGMTNIAGHVWVSTAAAGTASNVSVSSGTFTFNNSGGTDSGNLFIFFRG